MLFLPLPFCNTAGAEGYFFSVMCLCRLYRRADVFGHGAKSRFYCDENGHINISFRGFGALLFFGTVYDLSESESADSTKVPRKNFFSSVIKRAADS